jgi:hypothetical protein
VAEGYVRVRSQRRYDSLEHHGQGSRPDLLIEVRWSSAEGPAADGDVAEVVMVESKIGSGEGSQQVRRYAEHLDTMVGLRGKTLLYITRAYDPKWRDMILAGLGDDVRFEQLRWHDFYHFLRKWSEKDALIEEVMTFMEEQGMARDYRFSTTDLATLSGIPRAFEIMEETLSGEVKAKQESFAGRALPTYHSPSSLPWSVRSSGPLDEVSISRASGRPWTFRTAGARWAGRPGSSPR